MFVHLPGGVTQGGLATWLPILHLAFDHFFERGGGGGGERFRKQSLGTSGEYFSAVFIYPVCASS